MKGDKHMQYSSKVLLNDTKVTKKIETVDFQSARRKYVLYKKRLMVQRIMGIVMILVSLIGLTLEGGFLVSLAIGIALIATKDIVFYNKEL